MKYHATRISVTKMFYENLGMFILQSYLLIGSGQVGLAQITSLFLSFMVIIAEVCMSEYLHEFLNKFLILIACCAFEFFLIFNYMTSEDKRSQYIKDIFPMISINHWFV